MKDLEYIHFRNREEFRTWLQKYHAKSKGIWMVFYKKHTNKECIEYSEALEEILCFGWIDSIIKKIDDEKYARKITPRKDTKKWSELNKKIIARLIQNGKMTEAGFKKIGYSSETIVQDRKKSSRQESGENVMPDFIISEFSRNEPALINFNNLAPSHKRNYILWITNAVKEETVQKRLKESVELLKQNKKLGLK
jgi:uncharacterized protein YdeI (YjbR/CyaY-like superfamily)